MEERGGDAIGMQGPYKGRELEPALSLPKGRGYCGVVRGCAAPSPLMGGG